ncbi:hypothetical protein JCM10213_006121 [Rhodosporidiobolus nylandii]
MAYRLRSRESPAVGMFVGPANEPQRYELVEELSGPRDPILKRKEAPCVWMTKEQVSSNCVAIKVLRDENPHESAYEVGAERLWLLAGYAEPQMRGFLPSSHPGQGHCVRVLDYVHLPYSSGAEVVDVEDASDGAVVLELLGPSLADWQKRRSSAFFPLPLAKRLIRQLLLALDYLHCHLTQRRIVHCGVSLRNVLLSQRWTPEELAADLEGADPEIKLVGFDFARYFTDGYEFYREPGDYSIASPEQLLLCKSYGGWGSASAVDIWAAGVMVLLQLELALLAELTLLCVQTSDLLFARNLALNGNNPRSRCEQTNHPLNDYSASREIVLSLASLDPEEGWPLFFEKAVLVEAPNPRYPFNLPGVVPLPSLQQRIEAESRFSDRRDIGQLTSFLRACWTLDPYKRPSAKELLEHEWLGGVE